jgi:hypothetical protein
VNFQLAVIVNKTQLSEPIHKEVNSRSSVPIISAKVSWLIFGTTVSVFPSFPKRANNRRARAAFQQS